MGDFTVGSQELFSQGEGYGPASGTVSPLEHVVQETETLTYPLWGQNVLDWRTPKKEHNNVPPSLNIYVRFLRKSRAGAFTLPPERFESILKQFSGALSKREKVAGSAAEAKYDSNMVCELDEYAEENLTPHDYILRMALDEQEQVQLKKQGLKMLLDIFAGKTNEELSTEDGTMAELLTRHLDNILMPTQEFMQWYI